jgi:hypothetical protein
MKKRLLWIALIVGALAGAWLIAFGARGPCDAYRAQAGIVAAGQDASYRKAVQAGILDRADLGTWQCFAGAIQLKLRGRDAITVITVEDKKK